MKYDLQFIISNTIRKMKKRWSSFVSYISYLVSERKTRALPGFTLIELMVVLLIVVLISLVILTSTQRFNSAILLRSLAYEVGLSVREAQLYGVAVHYSPSPSSCSSGGTSNFCSAFGVHFDPNVKNSFFIFADSNTNGVYDSVSETPPIETFKAQYGFTISTLCAIDSSNNAFCAPGCTGATVLPSGIVCGNSTAINSLDMVFKRPDPDAIITINGISPPTNNPFPYSQAYIIVQAPGGATRSVIVSLTGQIIIKSTAN
jgi:prepilin-type N-terminal cleavage/methylation domain-containing protein